MAVGDKQFVLMASQLGTANGPAQLNSNSVLPILQGGVEAGNTQLALSNLGAGVRPNLLDNAVFIGGGSQQGGGQLPVNQRGQTSYVSGNVIDRWKLLGNGGQSLIIDTDGITLTSTAEYGLYFDQHLEQSVVDAYLGKTVTASVLSVGQNTANLSLNLYVDSTWTDYMGIQEGINSKQFAIPSTANYFYFSFGASAAGTCKLSAAKLELGDHQTLAYQDESGNWQLFETPNYAEELAKCQRYYCKSAIDLNSFISGEIAFAQDAEWLNCAVKFPVEMRVVPTVSVRRISWCSNLKQNLLTGSTSATVTGVDRTGFNTISISGITLQTDARYNIQYEASADL